MSRTLHMPELAESVVEGEIVQWLVEEGQAVAEDQPLVEVMTDKVTVEIPSPMAGVLEKHLAAEGDVVPVGGPLARFGDEDAGAGEGAAATGRSGAPAAGAAPASAPAGSATADSEGEAAAASEGGPSAPAAPPAGDAGTGAAAAAADEADDGSSLTLFTAGPETDTGPLPRIRKPDGAGAATHGAPPTAAPGGSGAVGPSGAPPAVGGAPRGPWGRPLAVPAARKRARELGIPLERIEGSGPHGRIRVHDVEGHASGAPGGPVGAATGAAGTAGGSAGAGAALPPYRGTPLAAAPEGPEEVREPFRGMRRQIAKQMVHSHLSTVRALHVDEADVTRLVELRARLKPRAARRGVALSYLPFVMKALAHALAAYPMLNARLDEEAGEVVRSRDVHLGMAVATERGLLVPVIRDASRRTVLDLGAEVSRLATAARDGTLSPDELRGGTFSVTNIGSIGGLFSFPIINAPEAAILGVHSIKKRPVVLDDDSIVARHMLYLSLSFDHRLVDGAEAALFTRHLIELLEEPEAMLLDA